MDESILDSLKNMLGILPNDTAFDNELISHINAFISNLTDIKIGPEEGFIVEDVTTTWGDFVSDISIMAAVREYLYAAIRLVFDPPSNSFVVTSLEKAKDEAFWRLYMKADNKKEG